MIPGVEPPVHRYITIYEVDEADIDIAKASMAAADVERAEAIAAGREPRVPISSAMAAARVSYWYAEASARATHGPGL